MSSSSAIRLAVTCAILCASACGPPAAPPSTAQLSGPAQPSPVVATIPLDAFGTDIAVSPDGTRAWVAASARVYVLDLAAQKVSGAFPTGDLPYALSITPDGRRAATVDLMQREIWLLDLAGGTILRRTGLGEPKNPALRPGIALTRDGTRAFVSLSQIGGPDSLRIINPTTGKTILRHGLDFHPGAIALSPDERFLYAVGCHGFCSDGTVHVLSAAGLKPIAQMQIASVPGGIAVAPDGARAYVANGLAAQVSVIDLQANRVAASVPVGAGALDLAVSADGGRVYVTNFDASSLSVIDAATDRELARVPIGKTPRAIALSPDGRTAYVTHSEPAVSVIDLTRLTP